MRTIKNFNDWALNKCYEYKEFAKNRRRFQILYYKNTTLLIDKKSGRTWKAICHKDDTFNCAVGIGVAFAKYQGEEIPVEVPKVRITELNYGDKFCFDIESYIYTYIARHPLSGRVIYMNEMGGISISSCDIDVYKI